MCQKGHGNNIPAMQLLTGISRNTQLKSHMYVLSLAECVWEFPNNALWDTRYHALLPLLSITWIKVHILDRLLRRLSQAIFRQDTT